MGRQSRQQCFDVAVVEQNLAGQEFALKAEFGVELEGGGVFAGLFEEELGQSVAFVEDLGVRFVLDVEDSLKQREKVTWCLLFCPLVRD